MREWKWGKRKKKGRWKKDLYREGGELSSQDERWMIRECSSMHSKVIR